MLIRFFTARRLLAGIGIAALLLVAAGLVVGEWFKLSPCPLCIFQRLLYLLVALFVLLGVALFRHALLRRVLVGVSFIAAVGGIATASYQTWLQSQPVSPFECGFGDPNLVERLVDWLGQLWPAMFLATGACSSKEWSFLGLSMANWSIVCFGALGIALVPMLRRRLR